MKLFVTLCLLFVYAWPDSLQAQDEVPENETAKILSEYPSKDRNYTRKNIYLPPSAARQIRLKLVIEEGLRKNPEQQVRNIRNQLLDLGWRDTQEEFWLPDIDLVMAAGPQRIARLRQGKAFNEDPTQIPIGSLGLSFGEYTVFNWGRDYADYLNSRASYFRGKRNLVEAKRLLRHGLINKYFKLSLVKQIERIYLNQLQHASFVYRLGREKAPQRKISRQEYLQARAEYLRSRDEYQQSLINSSLVDEQFAYMLGDRLDTNFKPLEGLRYEKINLPLREVLFLSNHNSPPVLNKKQVLENAHRSYEKTIKDNLPLPKFSINFGVYKQNFDRNGSFGVFETTSPGNKNIDLTASINLTWNLLGEGGFFNSRKNQKAHLQREVAEREFLNTRQNTFSGLRQIYKRILNLESKIEIFKARLKNSQKTFDVILQNYIGKKTKFAEFKHALLDLRDSEIAYETAKYLHLENKVKLANLMGMADLPGTQFDQLGQE